MPRYGWSDEDLYKVSQYVMNKLTDTDLLTNVPPLGAATEDEVKTGKRLFAEKGCASCHALNGIAPQKDFGSDLTALGAKIEGIGTNTMVVHGQATLASTSYSIQPDHIEVGSLIGLAAVTHSSMRIVRAGVEHLRSIRMGFERLGIVCEVAGDDLIVPSEQTLKIKDDFGGHVPKLEDQPWPAFPADLMSIAIVTATQCDGVILMFEKMFESRMFFVDKLIAMGGRIVLCDPHRAIVAGPSRLKGALMSSPDIRAGMAMLLAAACAEGVSTINNADQIERGYERIDERLNALGAKITRVPAR